MRPIFLALLLTACAPEVDYHPTYCVHVDGNAEPVQRATRAWEAALGRRALYLSECPEHAFPIYINMDSTNIDADEWYGFRSMTDGAQAYIDIPPNDDARELVTAVGHELGHVLTRSVDHSSDRRSVRWLLVYESGGMILPEDVDAVNDAGSPWCEINCGERASR